MQANLQMETYDRKVSLTQRDEFHLAHVHALKQTPVLLASIMSLISISTEYQYQTQIKFCPQNLSSRDL